MGILKKAKRTVSGTIGPVGGTLLGYGLGGGLGALVGLGLGGGFDKDHLMPIPDFAENRKKAKELFQKSQLEAQLAGSLQGQLAGVENEAAREEAIYAQGLEESTGQAIGITKEMLSRELEGVDAEAMEATRQVGEGQAKTGMLRSSFTQGQIEDVQLAKLQAKGELQLAQQEKELALKTQKSDTLANIARGRRTAQLERLSTQLDSAQARRDYLAMAASEQELSIELTQAGLRSQRTQMAASAIGGLAGSAARIFGMSLN